MGCKAAVATGQSLADSCCQCVAQTEITFVQRSSDNHAHDAGFESCSKCANVLEVRDPARCYHRDTHRPGDFFHANWIDTDLRSVASDVGNDHCCDPGGAKSVRRLGDGELTGLDPSFDRKPAFSNVDGAENS